jgi:hypothetical protein
MRRFKMLGLAVVAAMVMTAVAASGASALSASGGAAGGPNVAAKSAKKIKVKGGTVYEFCGSNVCPQDDIVLFKRTKTWEFFEDPGVGGFYETFKKEIAFFYDEGVNENCLLSGLKGKKGGYSGSFECELGEGLQVVETFTMKKL